MGPEAAIIAAAIASAGAQAGGQALSSAKSKKAAKLRSKETKRETIANMLNEAYQRNAEISGQRLQGGQKLAKGRSQRMLDASTLLREAYGI